MFSRVFGQFANKADTHSGFRFWEIANDLIFDQEIGWLLAPIGGYLNNGKEDVLKKISLNNLNLFVPDGDAGLLFDLYTAIKLKIFSAPGTT